MSQEKREIERIAPVVPFAAETHEITFIGGISGADTTYGIVYPVPATDAEAQARYNCTLSDLIRFGLSAGIATRVNYDPAFTFRFETGPDGKPTKKKLAVLSADHAKMQAIADDYKVGQRATGTSVKAEAAAYKSLKSEAAGLSDEEILAAIRAAAAKKTKK